MSDQKAVEADLHICARWVGWKVGVYLGKIYREGGYGADDGLWSHKEDTAVLVWEECRKKITSEDEDNPLSVNEFQQTVWSAPSDNITFLANKLKEVRHACTRS